MHRSLRFRGCRGFTLIELLVVFAILGVVIGVVPAALGRLHDAVTYRNTVQDISTLLRVARQAAVSQGAYTAVLVSAQQRVYGLEGKQLESLDASLRFELETAEIANKADGVQSILFLPQGGSTGGSISIVRAETGVGVRLRVDWLTGLVTQEAL